MRVQMMGIMNRATKMEHYVFNTNGYVVRYREIMYMHLLLMLLKLLQKTISYCPGIAG